MKTTLATIALVAAANVLTAAAEDIWATTSKTSITINTEDSSPIPLLNRSMVDSFAFTYRTGETVTAVAPDGTETVVLSAAASAGSQTFAPSAGGIWTLVNSASGKVQLGVPWSVYDDGGQLALAGPLSRIFVETAQEGPNRRVHYGDTLTVAYDGNCWMPRSGTAASALSFTAPSGTSTTTNLTGNGMVEFRPREVGSWIATLSTDAATLTSSISVTGGMIISVY